MRPWPQPRALPAGQAAGSGPGSSSRLGQGPGWPSPPWQWEWHTDPREGGSGPPPAASQAVLGGQRLWHGCYRCTAGLDWPGSQFQAPSLGQVPTCPSWAQEQHGTGKRGKGRPGVGFVASRQLGAHDAFAAAAIKLHFPEHCRRMLLSGLDLAGDVPMHVGARAGVPTGLCAAGCHHHPVPWLPCSTSGEGSHTDCPADAPELCGTWVQLLWDRPDPAASSPCTQPLA